MISRTSAGRPTTNLKFNKGSLMVGRVVKTAPFTRSIRNHFVKMDIPEGLEGFCNQQYRIVAVNNDKGVLTLQYRISPTDYVSIDWPVAGLNEGFGIKL